MDVWSSVGTAPRILNLGMSWGRVVSFTTPAALPPEKGSRYPIKRRLGGTQSRSRRDVEKKVCPCLESNHSYPACSSVKCTELFRGKSILIFIISPYETIFPIKTDFRLYQASLYKGKSSDMEQSPS